MSAARAEIETAVHALAAAITERDERAIAELLAPDFVLRSPATAGVSASEFLAGVRQIQGKIVFVRLEHVEVDVAGDSALATGVQHALVLVDGATLDERRPFADWLVRREGGRWQLQAAIDMPAQPPAVQSKGGLAEVAWRPPVLRGERVLLRGYELSDAAAIHGYASDVETTRYVSFETHTSIEGAYGFLNDRIADSYRRRELTYAICLLDQPERAIGGAGVRTTSEVHNTMELGYVLDRAYWGQRLVPEAARLVLDHAFETTDVARIVAPIFSDNTRSRRVAEKLGMTLDGILRSSLHLRGRRWDDAIYSILRHEWGEARGG
jgi:[ribosomal protein S5]-alanine N-acetyltransferase